MIKFLLVDFLLFAGGFYSMRKTRDLGDFFLGGREIGPWMSAFAYGTTYFSAVIFVGYAGKIGWGFGISSIWIGLGNAIIGSYLAWKILAKPTREMSEKLNVMTMPEFFQARFDSHALKIFAAVIIFIFLVPYSASVYMGLSYIFKGSLDCPIIISCFLWLCYGNISAHGRVQSRCFDGFIQGIVMLFGVGMLIYYAFNHSQLEGSARLSQTAGDQRGFR